MHADIHDYWRSRVKALGVDWTRPGAQLPGEVMLELMALGTSFDEIPLVTYSTSSTPRHELDRIADRLMSDAWFIPDQPGQIQDDAAQPLSVTSSDASPLVFAASASTTSGGNWLAVSPASGTAPASFSVSVTTTGLAAGSYTGSISLTSAGAANSPLIVPVTLTVGAPPATSDRPRAVQAQRPGQTVRWFRPTAADGQRVH